LSEIFKNGSRWLRVDFHLHTSEDKEFKYHGEEKTYVEQYINKLVEKEIKVGTITNHNKFNRHEYKKLKKEAKEKDILLLPGVELSVADGANGIHALIVFNEDEWLENGDDRINQFLDSVFLGIDNRENENARCKYSLLQVLDTLERMNRDYFILMAHIEDRCGFFKEFQGGRISEISRERIFAEKVLGFQKLRTRDNVKKLKEWMGYDISFVEGSDPKSIDDIGKGKQCYVKLGDFSFDSVKLALKDFKTKVSCEDKTTNRVFIKSISFEGGKLDGKEINFSEGLNTLIGIRGSGKSSILELIRYGLDIKFGSNAIDKPYKENLVKNAITSGGKIIIKAMDKHNKEYRIERIFGHETHIIDESGEELSISLDTLINNPLYFGQKDLSQTEGYEQALLDKLIGDSKKVVLKEIESKKNELIDNIGEFMRLSNIENDIKENETIISNCKHKLELFDKYGVKKKLNDQVIYNNDKLHIEATNKLVKKHLKEIRASMDGRKEDINETVTYSSELNKDLIEELHNNVKSISKSFNVIINEVEKAEEASRNIADIYNRFKNKLNDMDEEFAKVKREIDIPELDLNDFMKYNSNLEKALKEIKRLEKQKEERNSLKIKIKSIIRELNDLWLREFKIYSEEVNKVNESQDKLQIEIEFKNDKDAFLDNIKETFRGSGLRNNNYLDISQKYIDYLEIFADIYLGNNEFKDLIPDNCYLKIIEMFEAKLQLLIHYKTPNTIDIKYHGKPLS